MATKAQLIQFIMEMFQEANGDPIAQSKLEGFKKADLEEFIKSRNAEDELKEWLKR